MTRAIHATLVFLVVSSAMAHAQTPLVHVGAGGKSCGEWVTVREHSPRTDIDVLGSLAMTSWVQGFLVGSLSMATLLAVADTPADAALSPPALLAKRQAAFRTVSGWLFDPPDADAVQVWMDQYCRAHALATITDAATALSQEIVTKDAKR
jgi:hypothetical protein